MIQLRAFGSFDLHDDVASLSAVLSQSKRAALLAYLVLSRPGELHRRDALLALFWPESDQVRGRNALSQSLTFLRRALPEGVLVTRGTEEVGVAADRVDCDVVTFEAALAGGRWGEALALYRGPLLEGLHVAGAPAFMDWLERERERLRERAAGAAWRCAHEHVGAGELEEAEAVAQWALRLVPTDESAVRGFIEALAGAGDRAAALRFYGKFVEVLAGELEVEPAPETVAVVEAVRARSEPVEIRPTAMADRPARGRVAPTAVETAGGQAGRPWWRLRPWGAVAAVVLVGVGVVGYMIVRQNRTGGPGTLIGQGVVGRYDRVLVADLVTPFDPSLGRTASEWLRVELDQSDIVRPVDPTAIGAALRRMERDPSLPLDEETAREIAVRDGYPLIVVGQIDPVGPGYVVLARLEAAEGGEVLGRFRAVAASEAEMADALGEIGGEMRARIGESVRAIRRSPPLESVATSSLEALRLYSDAMRLWSREDRPLDAAPLLERAIAIDTTFAAAYWALGLILNHEMPDWDRQPEISRKAYQYRDRLNDYRQLLVEGRYTFHQLAEWADTTKPQPDECDINEPVLHLYEAYVRRHPEDPRPLQNYGMYQARTGRKDEALATFRRMTEMDPSLPGGWTSLYYGQLGMGRFDEARRTLDQWRKHVPAPPSTFDWAVANTAMCQGDYARADSVVGHIEGYFGPDNRISVAQAELDAVRGRMGEARSHYEDAVRRVEQAGHPAAAFVWITHQALVRLVALGDSAGETAEMTAALDRLPDTLNLAGIWIDVGLAYAFAGDVARARAQLDLLRRHGYGNWSVSRGVLGAAIALAEGKPETCLEVLAATETPCTFNGSVDLRGDPRLRRILAGRAHEALQQPDSAIAAYKTVTDLQMSDPLHLDAVFLFDTLERLGALHEARGDSAQAAIYYGRAAELWKDADPELQPRVRRLRERAAALGVTD